MKTPRRLIAAVAVSMICVTTAVLAIPFLMLGAGGTGDPGAPWCGDAGASSGDQAPTILGPAP